MTRTFARYMHSCANNIKMNLKGMRHEYNGCIFRLTTEFSGGLSKHSNNNFHKRQEKV